MMNAYESTGASFEFAGKHAETVEYSQCEC